MAVRGCFRAGVLLAGVVVAVLGLTLPAAAAPAAVSVSCTTGLGGGPPSSPGYFSCTAEASGFSGATGYAWTFNGIAAGGNSAHLGGGCANGGYDHVDVTATDPAGESATGTSLFQCHNGPSGA